MFECVELKQCNDCDEWKPVELYAWHSATRDLRHPYCRPCSSERSLRWERANRERSRATKAKYAVTKDRFGMTNQYAVIIKTKYGLSREVFWARWKKQKGLCGAGCETKLFLGSGSGSGSGGVSVDHEHVEGYDKLLAQEKVKYFRGLLCPGCNRAMGIFRDSVKNLRGAVRYLERYNGSQKRTEA